MKRKRLVCKQPLAIASTGTDETVASTASVANTQARYLHALWSPLCVNVATIAAIAASACMVGSLAYDAGLEVSKLTAQVRDLVKERDRLNDEVSELKWLLRKQLAEAQR